MILKKLFNKGQRGFTMLELLIIVFILGLLASAIIPNIEGFKGTGTLSAARTELQNVKTAVAGFYGEHHVWPVDSDNLTIFLSQKPNAIYIFNPENGCITDVADVKWTGIVWSDKDDTWTKS
jgi:prepilin-type N-terminal cleavage/methylation domain-containing protein